MHYNFIHCYSYILENHGHMLVNEYAWLRTCIPTLYIVIPCMHTCTWSYTYDNYKILNAPIKCNIFLTHFTEVK